MQAKTKAMLMKAKLATKKAADAKNKKAKKAKKPKRRARKAKKAPKPAPAPPAPAVIHAPVEKDCASASPADHLMRAHKALGLDAVAAAKLVAPTPMAAKLDAPAPTRDPTPMGVRRPTLSAAQMASEWLVAV